MEIRSFPRPPRGTSAAKPRDEPVKAVPTVTGGSGRERISRRRKIRKESRAKVLLVRTLALGTLTGVGLVVFVAIGILRTKEDAGEGWKDPNAERYQVYSGAKKAREFPPPASEAVVATVRKVLAMRNAAEFQDLVRLKGMSEAEAVDFLSHLTAREGKVTSVTWQSADNVNGLQLESAYVEFASGRPRIAYLTPDGEGVWRVDLASFAGHCSVPWDEFYSGPERSAELRAMALKDNYYNGSYADEHAWSAYSLSNGSSDHVLVGYCKKGGPADQALMRMLKFRQNFPTVVRVAKNTGGPGRQVEILSVLAEGWVLTDTPFDGGSLSEAPSEEK